MIQKRQQDVNIPGRRGMGRVRGRLYESREARAFWFGKSLDDVQSCFEDGLSIQRGHELLFMPRRVFQFYTFAFAQYVMSEAAIGDSDAAS